MYKWMYDRMVTEYSKESKDQLVQRIMALEEIECSDRCFANQCMAGTSIYDINELFSALEDMQYGFTYKNVSRVYKLIENAKGGEMLGASFSQISFNLGNAIGAFVGGIPISHGLTYNYTAIPGAVFAFIGFGMLYYFHKRYN